MVNINVILDTSKMPKPLKKEWEETIERLRKLPNVKIIDKEEDVGDYTVSIKIRGERSKAHFLVKDIENSCDLAEKYLNLEIKIKSILKK